MMLTGKKVVWELSYSDGSKKEFEGILIGLYPSASEGIYAVVLKGDGSFNTVGLENLRMSENDTPEIDRLTAENARMREGIELAQGNLHRFAILHHANELHGKAILSEAYEILQSALNGGKNG